MRPKHHKYTVADVAEACGIKAEKVRRDRDGGKVDLDDVGSVARYIVRHELEERDGSKT